MSLRLCGDSLCCGQVGLVSGSFLFCICGILVPPQIHPFDFGDESVFSGELVSATCSVTKGDFPLKISWLFNGNPIDLMNGVTVGQTNKKVSTLTIDSADKVHSGNYQCLVQNAAGKTSYSATLNVKGVFYF